MGPLYRWQCIPSGEKTSISSYLQDEMEYAERYFVNHYNVEEFAKSRNMSIRWFLRNFKQSTKVLLCSTSNE